MPHVTRHGRAAFGNPYNMSRRGPASDTEPPADYKQARRAITEAFNRYAQTGVPPTPEELERMEAGLREGVARGEADLPPHYDPVVYYFRVGNRIKIGWSGNLESRIISLTPEEVLGTEPGDQKLERHRHRQFRDHHVTREWFEDCPAIRAHIATFRKDAYP